MPYFSGPRRGISPLWIIVVFLSFCETVLGLAVTRTADGIQLALTCFVIVFPLLICTAFFVILWKKPYVLYNPAEFTKTANLRSYVEAMHSRESVSISSNAMKNIEGRMGRVLAILETHTDPDKRAEMVLEETVQAVQESVVRIDSRPLLKNHGRVWEEPFEPSTRMSEFLDNLWVEMEPAGLPPFTFGEVWALKVIGTSSVISLGGRSWAEQRGMKEDTRPVSDLGIRGGMSLEVVALHGVRREDFVRYWN